MESSRRSHRVSSRQLDLLWEFLNNNRDIACAYNRTLQAKDYSKRKWREIAEVLNAQGDGAHKDWAGWCKYWVDYKAKIKKKVGALRASHMQTGGGPSAVNPLSDQESRFLEILGEDYGQGIPGVRVEPPPQINVSEADTESPASQSILQHFSIYPSSSTNHPQSNHTPTNTPTLEPTATAPNIQEPLTSPTIQEPTTHPAATLTGRSPRHRRRRRETPMSQEAARRALVRTSQVHSDAAVRTADEVARGVQIMAEVRDIFLRIERILHGAFPTIAAPENCE